MDTIIGLGQIGCAIADKFARHEQYQTFKIGIGLEGLKKDGIYDMPPQNGPENYEQSCPNMRNFFKSTKGEILFVLGGAEDITGAALHMLQYLNHCDINILYVRPDVQLLPDTKKQNEWVIFNVLQEYARSGVFKKIYLVDNTLIEEILGEVPVVGYFDKLNDAIVSTMHMINIYNHIDSVNDTFSDPYETHRMLTFGIVDLRTGGTKMFFPLDGIKEIRYYYAINEDKLKEDGKLFSKIKKQVKKQASDDIKTSYGIFSTDYDNDYAYVLCYAPSIQRQKINDAEPINLFA